MKNHYYWLFIFHLSCCPLPLLHAEVITDGTLGKVTTLEGEFSKGEFSISHDLGQQLGGNLFHSFQTFNINTGETATFTGPNSVENILARVTGEERSLIDGTLRSEIPNANLYLLNPNGILLGEQASLDIQGSFHASTADYLRLGENGRFSASSPANSVLTVASPTAFGFLGHPAPITIQGSHIEVPESKTLSIMGGDLEITDSFLWAPSGYINLASVASTGEIVPTSSDLVVTTFDKLGKIELSQSSFAQLWETGPNLNVSGDRRGQIFIRAGQFILDKAWIVADTYAEQQGLGIDIFVDGDMHLMNGANLTADNYGKGQGGHITINTQNSLLLSGINVEMLEWLLYGIAEQDANVSLETVENILSDIRRQPSNISLDTILGKIGEPYDKELIFSFSMITTNNSGEGIGGNIEIRTPNLAMSPGVIQTATEAGHAGHINIDAQQLKLHSFGFINTTTRGFARAGNIDISATDTISIANYSTISASTEGANPHAHTGNITLNTQHLTLKNAGGINSYSGGLGNAGTIEIMTDTALLTNEGDIITEAIYASGGEIDLTVYDNLEINNSWIMTFVEGDQEHDNAGDITIGEPRFLTLDNTSQLVATANRGRGGNITLTADYFIQSSESILDASSRLGVDGQIIINSPNIDLNSSFVIPPDFLDITRLAKRCEAIVSKDLSSFHIKGRDGHPTSPEDLRTHDNLLQLK